MERESNEHIKKIIDSIKSIIFRNKIEPTPENIIKYTSEAILNLKDEKSINDLTSVLFVYKDFMQDDEILNNVACKLIEDGFEDKGLRIFKVFIQNEHFYEAHLDLLLSLCRNKNNNKKIKSVLEQFLSKCRDCKLIEASFNKLSDYEFLYAYELFFSYLNEHFNAKVRLEGIFERTLKIIDTDKRNKMFNLFLSLILKYTCWLSNIDEVRDHVSDTKKEELIDLMKRNLLYEGKNNDSTLEKDYDTFLLFYKKEIDFINNYIRKTFDFTYSDNVILLKIIGKLLEIDRIFLLKYKVNIYRLNKEIKNHVKMIILGEEINIKEIDKFIESVKHVLIPEFIDLIRELGSLYNLGKQDKYAPVLRSIVCNISIEELINIVDIDYEKWIPVLKCSVNNDLKIFIELYGKIGGSKALILFPSFCNFCTDNENSILCLIDILKANLNNSLYYCTICAGLKNILNSHELNLKNIVYMRNEIPKETSINIIRSVCSLDLFYCILRNYKEEKVVRDLLFLLIDRLVIPDRYIDNSVINCNVEILRNDANVLYDFIEVFPQKEILQLKNFTLTSVLECLRIFKFYVPLLDFNFNMISKLFELVQSEDVRIQKKTYEVLYYFSQYNKINVCLCDTLYSNEVVSSIKYPAMKYRLLFLYKVFRNKCTCFITHQEKMSRLLQTIIICMYIANNSAQKIAEEIIYDLVQDFGVEDILILLEKGIYAEDIKIKSGVLCTFSSILRDFGTKIEENRKVSFYDYMFKIYKEVNALVIIKLIITYIKYTEDIVDEKVCDILNYYIDSRKKKYRKDIRDALFLMNKNEISISKKLRRYLTFKIPTNKKILQITKKNEIIISEEKK